MESDRGKGTRYGLLQCFQDYAFNIHTLEWDREILGLLGIPSCMLPEVKECSGDLGETEENIFGSRIKIAGCAGDQQAALLGNAVSVREM